MIFQCLILSKIKDQVHILVNSIYPMISTQRSSCPLFRLLIIITFMIYLPIRYESFTRKTLWADSSNSLSILEGRLKDP